MSGTFRSSGALGLRGIVIIAAALHVLACSVVMQAAGYPPEAGRKSPPPGIETRALKKGAELPPVTLASTKGELSFEKGKRHVLVFYRGAW
jgi:hypothetical protein